MRRASRSLLRAPLAQAAALVLLAGALASPGCGCNEDVGGIGCACEETVLFASAPPFTLPANVALINLIQDPNTGCVGFGATIATFPTVYMAESDLGTIVRIDTNTGDVLGEYATAPRGLTLSPSRTTVDRFGECWVGNRTSFPLATTNTGSVMRVGIAVGGTRGNRSGPLGGPYTFTPNLTGQYLQGPFTYLSPSVADRDGDGFIRTSSGLGDVLPWDAGATGGDDLGGISLAEDECVVTFARVSTGGTRGLAIDCANDLWVGGLFGSLWQKVSGSTGVPGITRNIGPAYGGMINGNNVLWSVQRNIGINLHDISANTTTFVAASGIYGIAIDPCDGTVWTSSLGVSIEPVFNNVFANQLRQWSSAGVMTGAWSQPTGAQGLSIDQLGDVWVSQVIGGDVWRFSSTGTLLNTISTDITGATGTAVDQNGKIWVSDLLADSARRIDPAGPAVDLTVPLSPGSRPYNYSDMTGKSALSSCGETGFAVLTHDSTCAGLAWGRVTWQTTGESVTCTVAAEVRASDDPLNYPTSWTPVINGQSFCGQPPVLGQYVQVRVTLNRPPGCPPSCNPQLCALNVECCESRGASNYPPTVTIDLPITVPTPAGPTERVIVSGRVVDPNGGTPQASWSVGGVNLGPAVLDGTGGTQITRDFPDGVTEVVLTGFDGQNTVTAKTSVTIGDHVAPIVLCPSGPPIQAGSIVVRTFEVAVPDLQPGTTVSDNLAQPAQLLLSQSPAAGLPVQQGTHRIIVTATDPAGNVGSCAVLLIVEGVVSVAGVVQYQIVPVGTPISVTATYAVPQAEIAESTVLLDGVPVLNQPGAFVGPLDLVPPAGDHELRIVVTNFGGIASRSAPLSFRVQ